MHLPPNRKNEKAGIPVASRLACPSLWLAVCIGLLVNGCASHNEMEFHPGKTAEKSISKRAAVKASATPSKTNLTLNPASEDARLSVTNNNRVITLADPWAGKVAFVNQTVRFVILDYSLSQIPPMDQRLSVFRKGLRVGEVKISGQPQNGYVAADITAGEIQNGDETRRE